MGDHSCRSCGGRSGTLVLDLGLQPACDSFPSLDDPGPDPVYPLRMWLCARCGLAQLVEDSDVPEEPRGTEPAALVGQAVEAVERVHEAGWLSRRSSVAEYGSPHGGSWLELITHRGLHLAGPSQRADVIVDCFGLMHAADQSAALAERAARLAPGGVLLLQYHSLDTIVRLGQWNALRHGHYAYYSATALTHMLADQGFCPRMAWKFDLYGGTILLAATRVVEHSPALDNSVQSLLEADASLRIDDPAVVRGLQRDVEVQAGALHDWLVAERRAGRTVLGYGAASRAVTLLLRARVDSSLLGAVADLSPAKQGRRMPGSYIPIICPSQLVADPPDTVLLLLPDLLPEVRHAYPEIEASGATWTDVTTVTSATLMP